MHTYLIYVCRSMYYRINTLRIICIRTIEFVPAAVSLIVLQKVRGVTRPFLMKFEYIVELEKILNTSFFYSCAQFWFLTVKFKMA